MVRCIENFFFIAPVLLKDKIYKAFEMQQAEFIAWKLWVKSVSS